MPTARLSRPHRALVIVLFGLAFAADDGDPVVGVVNRHEIRLSHVCNASKNVNC